MVNTKTTQPPQDLLTREEIEAMQNECNEVEEWLRKKRCSCLDIRGENPACEPCKAIDLIENLFFIVKKYHELADNKTPLDHQQPLEKDFEEVLHKNMRDLFIRETPQGWQLVPKVLTEEMLCEAAYISYGPDVNYQEHWDAMLSTAPTLSAKDNKNEQ